MIYLHDLNELENIIDQIEPEEYETIFTEENTIDFVETALYLMDRYIEDNPTAISEPDFHDIFIEEIKELFYAQFEEQIYYNEEIEDDIDEVLDETFKIFFTLFYNERSFEKNFSIENTDSVVYNNLIKQKLDYLRNIPQPPQRTNEWYEFRHNLITASNAYKAFESQSTINQLIYEKCQPLNLKNNEEKQQLVNTNTTFHWGQKYEPLSVMIYEYLYHTKIEDFGCIQHEKYKFIGASPDGINIDENSKKYGRMLEIKNIVNREINGVPKKEYWIQMQLQMEVCDLDECDFLETKFIEYDNFESFKNDNKITNFIFDNNEYEKFTQNINNMKGMILYFNTKEAKPFYVYKPLNIIDENDIIIWEENMIDLYQSEKYSMTFIKIIYWKLEKLSCVLVQRNKKWFEDNIKQLEKVWKIIEEERISGYDHRAPNKKNKKEQQKIFIEQNKGCFLNFQNYSKNIIVQKIDNTDSGNIILDMKIENNDKDKNNDN
jgi:putative phage-type endonuclease